MRTYTVQEAQALLPSVVPVLERLRAGIQELQAVRAAASVDARGASADGALTANPWAEESGDDVPERLGRVVQAALEQLGEWGIEVKDPAQGLIDFFHEREGRVVFLCYLLGEPGIAYWHTVQGGFAGRRPI
ncbi:MAG: DUF2203 domain-containing protein [Tepidiformaceae bacterium]